MAELRMRPYQEDDDYWRIREFLREIFRLNQWRELSWQVYRFDYCRWHVYKNVVGCHPDEVVFLWEQPDGRLAAVLNAEERGDAFLQVHPGLRTSELEEQMLEVAEERLADPGGGARMLRVWAHQHDTLRQRLLVQRGYARSGLAEYQRRCSLEQRIPTGVPTGYGIRALGDVEELPARSLLSWRAFHPGEPDERYEGWEWYTNIQRAPLYRRDLDLVAVAPDGELAAFCTIWFDDVNRTGGFEPVGTAPAHQRRGLGRALMYEGQRRLKQLGAISAHVGSHEPQAHALYTAAGFTEYELLEPWAKSS